MSRSPGDGWTDENVATLREWWGKGKSAAEIVKLLPGLSRSAVIGKAHRLGLTNPHGPRMCRPATGRKPYQPRPPREPRPPKVVALKPKSKTPVRPLVDEDASHRKPWLECVTSISGRLGECKAIVGDPDAWPIVGCGAPAHGPFCAHHAAIYYRPTSKMRDAA
jgi:GcrA cell cycle regulator